ncbi:MAG TPA: hypothetical protein VJ729_17960 [Nitrososphaeraceae archaeon]|jgi:hypothetical protein|nr:hypothetical protein [Nitrososphaeraceae archaeon]
MGKSRNAPSKSSSDEALPDWAEEEIRSVPLDEQDALTRTGYILDIYNKDSKIDIQLYESLPDGRTIIENLDVPRSIDISSFMKGFVYEFKIKVYAGQLSPKVVELLKTKFGLEMDRIYKFELQQLQLMDIESDQSSSSGSEEEEED